MPGTIVVSRLTETTKPKKAFHGEAYILVSQLLSQDLKFSNA